MSCCGGGCCWWKKKSDPSHPDPSMPSRNPPDLSMPSRNPPVKTGEEPSSSNKPFSAVHLSMPSIHRPVESSSSEKPFSPTLAEVLTGFEKADIAKADEFIKAIKEQLEGVTVQKNASDAPSTSASHTDRLSIWASFTESGATFLKFVSDHIGKIPTKGDFFQSGEATKIVGDMLRQIGQVHWAVAGLSIVGYLVSKCQQVSENRAGYVDLLKVMIDLASHIKNLNYLILGNEKKEKLENAFQYIVEGSIFCAFQLDSGNFFSFLKSSINSDTLSGIRSKIDQIYQDLQLTAEIETLAQLPVVLPLSQPAYPKNAVGIEEQLEAVNTLLTMKETEDSSSSAVVVWGVGGIGKTTLAQAVVSTVDRETYNYARIELDEVSEKNNYKVMQQQILKDAFPNYNSGREINLRDDSDGRDKLKEAFKSETNKPVFLFIDNALQEKDLDKILPEDLRGLPQRSRILITTRTLSVTDMLQDRGLQCKDHRVKTLSPNHAAEILCNDPAIRDSIKDDLEKMVKLCNGIPLVLKMVGAHLRKQKYNVHRCTQIVGALQSGGNIKENDLSNRLFHFVYEKLEVSTQEAFLDICCFFDKGFPRRIVEYIVGAEEVTSLQEAALISTVMGESNYSRKSGFFGDREEEELLSVHDIIRSIGRSLSKSSRIMDLNSWREAEKDERKLKGIKGVWLEGITVWLEDKDEDCMLEKRHLDAMEDTLRILVWTCGINVSAKDAVRLPELRSMKIDGDVSWVNVEALDKLGVLECEKLPTKQRGPLKLPESLRYISVQNQPAVPWDLVPNSPLEELHLYFSETSESSDEEFDPYFSETSESPDLELDLFFSETSKPSNEERDDSENAFNGFLHGLNKLKTLIVDRCYSLCELPQQVCKFPQLSRVCITNCRYMERLPQLFWQLETLTHLKLSRCKSLKELPESFGQLKALTHLDLYCCSSLKELPYTFDQLEALQWLDLKGLSKLESDICLMDDNIKIVQKSEHSCTDCWKDKKLKIES